MTPHDANLTPQQAMQQLLVSIEDIGDAVIVCVLSNNATADGSFCMHFR
jgi:hypothetical protein